MVLVTSTVAGASWAAAETVDVKYYGKLDLAPEDEKEESREKQLGLVDLPQDMPRHARPAEEGEEAEVEEGDDGTARNRPNREVLTPAAAAASPATGGASGPGSTSNSGGEEA